MASSILFCPIYLAVLNLPRQNCYKIQNFCLIGIIPGPHETELTVNSYINPLISDLKLLCDGVPAQINYFGKLSFGVNEESHSCVVVSVNWFVNHPDKDVCGKSTTVWDNLFQCTGYIYPECIKSKTITLVDKLNDSTGNVLFVSP